MKARLVLASLFLLSGVCGCALFGAFQEAGRESMRMFKPDGGVDTMREEANDDWDFVGEHARGIRGTEREPDGGLKKLIYSERALDIERSLGVE